MNIFNYKSYGFEKVIHFTDGDEFSAYIAIHDTKLGPGLGGCRVKKYESEGQACDDVMNLARAMTYKNSLAGLNYGGAKMVVNMDAKDLDEKVLKTMAECINFMDGKYYSGTDLGTTLKHMKILRNYTKWVEEGVFGDTSINTALGIFYCIEKLFDKMNKIPSVWVEGCGKVGMELIRLLKTKEYNVWVTDTRPEAVEEACDLYGTTPLVDNLIHSVNIFSPCAIGNRITNENIDKLPLFEVICGGANNQLEDPLLARKLLDKGILYCPDYLVNAGGVITMAAECDKWSQFQLTRHVMKRADLLLAVCEIAKQLNIDMLTTANFLAEKRFK